MSDERVCHTKAEKQQKALQLKLQDTGPRPAREVLHEASGATHCSLRINHVFEQKQKGSFEFKLFVLFKLEKTTATSAAAPICCMHNKRDFGGL